RWLSGDPIAFEAGDSNLYRYVANAALMNSDPSGLVKDDIKYINYLAKKYGLSEEGRAALHEALRHLKGRGGLVPKAVAEQEAQAIKSLGGKFVKGGGIALSVLFAWLMMENTAQAAEVPHDWRDGGMQWWGTQREKCECARFQASLIVPSWWAVFGEVEWGDETRASNWVDFGCMDVEDCRALEDEPRVIDETHVTGYTIYNTSRVRCRFGGVLYGPPPRR
ncbi:RHS repeat-associated core domain-containing protein, partial [Thermopirellula anaerolimosa]